MNVKTPSNENKLDAEIESLRARLSELYAERKRSRTNARVRQRVPMQERIQSIKELLNKGLGVAEIASLMNLSKNTVSAYIYHLIWDQAQESLLAKNKASVVRPNEYGGETWDYDMHDFQEEKAEINKNLGFPVGVLRATAFHRDHLKECDRCSLLLKGMNQLKRKQARKIS